MGKLIKIESKNHWARKLDVAWTPEILEMAAREQTLDKVVQAIKDKWGVVVTKSTVSKTLRAAAAERAEASKAVIKENIAGYVLGDLEILKATQDQIVKLKDAHYKKGETDLFLKTVDRLVKVHEKFREHAGLNDQTDSNSDEAIKEEICRQLDKATAKVS